jgi:hypothetical protein
LLLLNTVENLYDIDPDHERCYSIAMEEGIMVTNKGAGRTSRRAAWVSALLVGLATVTFAATPVWAGKIHGKLRGTVDIPGTSLTLPLAAGSPNVIATLFLGGAGGPPVLFTITPSTKGDAEDSKDKANGSVTIHDGDSVEVKAKAQQVGAIMEIVATKIELEIPEIEAFGVVDVPGTSLALPLLPGSPNQTFTLFIGGIGGPPIPIVVTPNTRVRGGTILTLLDNDFIEVKAVLQGGQVVALKIGQENQDEVEDEDD